MRANELPPVPGSVHKKKRVGRGNSSGHGTYSGRGIKGQQSRSGRDLRIGFEGGQNPLIRALSRRRGFNNPFRVEFEPVNVGQLNKLAANSDVTSESLRAAGLVKSARLPVKVLGDGDLSVALKVDVDRVSASAKAKIEAAGGSVTERITPKTNGAKAAAEESETPAQPEETSAPARSRRPRAQATEESGAEENTEEASED